MDNFFMYKKAVRAMDEINRVMEGKGHTVHQIMTAILAGGHILIEDIPGVGKTTLALAFSKVLGLDYQRIQFTPDIMPTDIAGFSIYHQGSEELIPNVPHDVPVANASPNEIRKKITGITAIAIVLPPTAALTNP